MQSLLIGYTVVECYGHDNLNVHKSVRHEREGNTCTCIFTAMSCNTHSNSFIFSCLSDKHNCMLNITSRLAVRLQNLPNWNVDWADSQPQRTRQSLNISDFLPSSEDARHLKERATAFLMKFLAEEFDSLSDLQPFVPKHQSPHPEQR